MAAGIYNSDDPVNKLMSSLGLDPKKVVRMHVLFDPDSMVVVRVEIEPDEDWVNKLCDTVMSMPDDAIIVERNP